MGDRHAARRSRWHDRGSARLRHHWPDRTWRKSREGNWYLNSDGVNIVVSEKGGAWTVYIENRETELGQRGRKAHPSLEAAKLAAFDALMWARRNLEVRSGAALARSCGTQERPKVQQVRGINRHPKNARLSICREIQHVALEEVAFIPLGTYSSFMAMRGDLRDRVNGFAVFWNLRRA